MGCACAKEREISDEYDGKETLARIQAGDTTSGSAQSIKTLTSPLQTMYRLGTSLKRSETGELKRAEYLGTYQLCFMKVIKKASGRPKLQQKARLNSDVDRLSHLDHPYILKTLEATQDDDNFYLAMEAFAGGQFQDYLADPRFHNEGMLARLMDQVFATLSYCHQLGIIHGNLSPQSLVFPLTPEGSSTRIKVTGFGEFDSIPGAAVIRPSHFRAPERNTSNNEKCDIWSCGVIIYVLISGHSPFGVPVTQDPSPDALKKGVSFPPDIWSGRSREVISLLASMLDLNPQSRYTAVQCRMHPWITQNVKTPTIQAATVKRYLFSIKKVRKRTVLQNAVLRFILQRVIKEKDIESLLDPFSALDIDGDGVLNREEVLAGFMRLLLEEDAVHTTKRVFEVTEHNGKDVLTFSEFLICALSERKLLTPENLRLTFSCVDRSGQGAVSVQDIRAFFNIKDTADLERVTQHSDENALVSFEGFASSLCNVNI